MRFIIFAAVFLASGTAYADGNACVESLQEYYNKFPGAKVLAKHGYHISPVPIRHTYHSRIRKPHYFLNLSRKKRQEYVDAALPWHKPRHEATFPYTKPPGFTATSYFTVNCKDTRSWKHFVRRVAQEGSGICTYNGKTLCFYLDSKLSKVISRKCPPSPYAITSTMTIAKTLKTVAVNAGAGKAVKGQPRLKCRIPYGSYVYINFRDSKYKAVSGWFVATDTGGASSYNRCWIDVFVGKRKPQDRTFWISTNNVDVWVYPVLKGKVKICRKR